MSVSVLCDLRFPLRHASLQISTTRSSGTPRSSADPSASLLDVVLLAVMKAKVRVQPEGNADSIV